MTEPRVRTVLSTGEEVGLLLPRFGTPRNYERRTLGAEVGEIARKLGQPLLPHQQYLVDVALELDDDDSLVYREVDVAWMRRQGKTNLVRSLIVHRNRVLARRWGPQFSCYTAQSGIAARRKWEHDQVNPIDKSAYGPLGRTKPRVVGKFARVKLDNNDPGIFWRNGSIHRPAPPTETAGHGDDVDLAVIDEAFAHQDDRVEQAYGPAMLTRPSPQLWVMSAAGTERSAYWWRKVKRGREACEAGRFDGPTCYSEYSSDGVEAFDDPATWYRRMPALDHTITEAAVAAELAKVLRGEDIEADDDDADAGDVGLEQFLRPYLGIWCRVPITATKLSRVISEAAWLGNVDEFATARYEAFGVHVSDDGATAAIGFAGWCGDRRMIGVFDHRPGAGTAWLAPVLKEIRTLNPQVPIAINPRSAVSPVVLDMEAAAGGELVKTSAAEFAAACGALKIGVDDGTLCYRRQRSLEDSLGSARQRKLSGAWAWEFPAGVDGTPVVSVTLALHAHRSAAVGGELWFATS